MPHFYSRRDILKLFGVTPLAAAAGSAVAAPQRWWGKAIKSGEGPKLFLTASQLPELRERWANHPRFNDLREGLMRIDRTEERKFLREEINLNDPLRDLLRAGDRAEYMAWIYLMTGDEDAADLAVECTRTIMKFPVWDFFLEGGEKVVGVQRAPSTTIAVACAIDYLGDYISKEERAEWLRNLGEKGCEPCFTGLHNVRYPRDYRGWDVNPNTPVGAERLKFPNDSWRRPWITQDTNLRAKPASALAVGLSAIAVYGDDHSEIDRWLEMAVASLKVFEQIYLPDGGYGEGVHYADYTTRQIILGLEALNNSGVLPLELDINWQGNVESYLQLSMATDENPYEVVNIGDNGRPRELMNNDYQTGRFEMRTAVPCWVARKYGDSRAQWFAQNLGALDTIWSFIYFDPSVPAIEPPAEAKTWYSDLDWIVARTGYQPQDLVASLRSGNGYNHEHGDRNSIIVKAFGEQLIADPIRPPYNFHDPAFMMRESAGHSAVLVDGEGHLYNNGVEGTNSTICQARLTDQGSGPGYDWWTSDATQAYRVKNYNSRAIVRSMVVFYDLPAVIIVDRMTKYREESIFEARYFGYNWDGQAKLTADGDSFTIKRPGAFASGKVYCRDPFTLEVEHLPIPEDVAKMHPYVVQRSSRKTMATTLVSAVGLGRTGDSALPIDIREVGEAIEVSVGGMGRKARVRILDKGDRPEISATI
jgi:hypothetical protein